GQCRPRLGRGGREAAFAPVGGVRVLKQPPMRRRRVLGWSVAIAVLVLCLIVAGGICWAGKSSAFPRWALERAASATGGALQPGAVSGSLVDGLAIDYLVWQDAGTRVELRGLSLGWLPRRLLAGEFRLSSLRA